MALTVAEAAAVNIVLRWICGSSLSGGEPVTGASAYACARLLAEHADRTLGAGHTHEDLADTWPATPPHGERAALIAASVAALEGLAADLRTALARGEMVSRDDLTAAIGDRVEAIQASGGGS